MGGEGNKWSVLQARETDMEKKQCVSMSVSSFINTIWPSRHRHRLGFYITGHPSQGGALCVQLGGKEHSQSRGREGWMRLDSTLPCTLAWLGKRSRQSPRLVISSPTWAAIGALAYDIITLQWYLRLPLETWRGELGLYFIHFCLLNS